jgi:predicted permease
MSGRYRRYFRLRGGADEVDRELDEEIRMHIELRTEELVRRGLSADAAKAEAVRRFGDVEEARRRLAAGVRKREGRLRWYELVDSVRRDVVLALRQAWRSPGYSAIAVLTFALGIGLTTAMYTVVDRVVMRPLPYPEPDRLVALLSVDSSGTEFPYVSMDNWLDWREQGRSLSVSALHMERGVTVATGGAAVRARGQVVAGSFFDVIGARMLLGRVATEAEAQAGVPVAVVSESLWRTMLEADRSLARKATVDGRAVDIIGVVAEGTEYPAGTQIWITWPTERRGGGARNNVNWFAVGRLAPGASPAGARRDLSAVADGIRARDPAGIYSYGVGVLPLRDLVVGDASRALVLLLGSVLFVLLIACVNLAGLGLARASSRSSEVAVRRAIGASRSRILRQMLTENLLYALVGGGLGIALAVWSTRLMSAMFAAEIPRAREISTDLRVLAFALAATLASGLIAGVAPAVKVSGVGLRTLVGGRGTVRGGRNVPGAALVAGEVALAFVLLAGGGLLLRSFRAVISQDLGYDANGVVVAEISLAAPKYAKDEAERILYWERLLERMRGLPGVHAAAVALWIPTGMGTTTFVDIEGVSGGRPGAGYRIVSDDYFRALDVPLLAGRMFDTGDTHGSGRVALVNRQFVERYWPDGSALGRRIRASSMEGAGEGGPQWLTVVGVVGDVRHWSFEEEAEPEMYVLYRQLPAELWSMHALVRGDPARAGALREAVRREAQALDPALAVDVSLLEERVGSMLRARRLTMSLLAAFGALALLLAAIGVYGLLSFAVAQRTAEIGVRAALGARQSGIVRLMLGSALRVVALGLAAGLLGAFWLTRLLTSLLFDVNPLDPVSFAGAAAVLTGASVAAASVPALRASRVDPLDALRGAA